MTNNLDIPPEEKENKVTRGFGRKKVLNGEQFCGEGGLVHLVVPVTSASVDPGPGFWVKHGVKAVKQVNKQ